MITVEIKMIDLKKRLVLFLINNIRSNLKNKDLFFPKRKIVNFLFSS